MNKSFLSAILLSFIAGSVHADEITMSFTAGVLSNSLGTPISDGSLLQIIASPDTTFSAPTTTDFLGVSSNDILLWSGSMDSSTSGVSGVIITPALHFDLATYPVSGDYLIIRWFPSLTTADTAPGATTYGEYGYNNDNTWIAGGASSTLSYSFLTQSSGAGSSPDSLGYASNTVSPVPEPSSYATVIGLFSLGMMLLQIRRRARAAAKSA
jgi:hypothetical protein